MKKLFVFLLILLLLVGCNGNQEDLIRENGDLESELTDAKNENNDLKETLQRLEDENRLLKEQVNELENQEEEQNNNQGENNGAVDNQVLQNENLLVTAAMIMQALAEEDFTLLSTYVSPTKGVRLSPYQYVDTQNDQVFTVAEISNFFGLSPIYEWGSYDGIGDPINLNTQDYYNEFIYDEDYLMAPNIGQNTTLSSGNTIINVETVYPSASYVEFYFPGFDPQFAGMDWSSLTLVLELNGNQWELVGIINGQWTI